MEVEVFLTNMRHELDMLYYQASEQGLPDRQPQEWADLLLTRLQTWRAAHTLEHAPSPPGQEPQSPVT